MGTRVSNGFGVVAVAVVVVVTAGPAGAQPARTPAEAQLEREMHADVERASPTAATAYDEGNAAREARRLDEAVAAYRRAIELAPEVDHPHRRLCSVLELQGRLEEAVTECEAALRIRPDSPFNKVSLAGALASRGDLEGRNRGLELARAAVTQRPDDPSILTSWCQVLAASDQLVELRTCVNRLLHADPEGLSANYLAAMVTGSDGKLDAARHHLARARDAGLPPEEYQRLAALIDEAEAGAGETSSGLPVPDATLLWIALWIFVGWVGLMIVLLTTGYVLSRVTLAAVAASAGERGADASGTEREQRLRKIYRVVLAICGVYFYLSVPILIAMIVIAGGGAIYLMFAAGYVPVKLAAIVAIAVVVTVGAIARGLIVRAKPAPLGERLDLDQAPKLKAMIHEVADAVGTRPADAAYLTPGTEMAVTERAGIWSSVRGKRTERSLIMGVGLFDGMTQLQLRSVLAHEHGHFRNADTAGGGFALAVRRSIFSTILRMAHGGVASNFNPVWWFLRGYHRIYLVVSQGASRLQEVLADRWAVQAYGSAAFVAGYRHVVARSVELDRSFRVALDDVLERGRALPNLYHYVPSKAAKASAPTPADVAHAIEQAMTEPPSLYDSHPAAAQRIQWAETLAVVREPAPADDADIWSLFDEGRDALERRMTAVVRASAYEQTNFRIAADRRDADEGAYDADETEPATPTNP